MPTQKATVFPKDPLNRLAVSMSGGGYRAAAFHLGALSLLNELQYKGEPLIQRVYAISTVSGGTIPGVLYAQSLHQKDSFEDFFNSLRKTLKELNLVRDALESLNEDWGDHKRKNLINAFAKIYDQRLTQSATFRDIDNVKKVHLKEVTFNATDLNNGLAFRFQNEGIFGNYKQRVNQKAKREVRLSDIIASSSCFPGGFEPLSFPSDFGHKNAPNLQALRKLRTWPKDLAIMDGGIVDNQGIQSLMLSESRNAPKHQGVFYDLIIVSDVASPHISPYEFSQSTDRQWLRSFNFVKLKGKINRWTTYAWILLAMILLAIGLLAYNGKVMHFSVGFLSALAMLALGVLLAKIWSTQKVINIFKGFRSQFASSEPFLYDALIEKYDMSSLNFSEMQNMLVDRIRSVRTMVSEVFLKQIRKLNYEKLYEDPAWEFRRIGNVIGDLNKDSEFKVGRKFIKPSKTLLDSCVDAQNMGTKLWFDEIDEDHLLLDDLIATGQATLCFNLIKYLSLLTADKAFKDLGQPIQDDIKQLEKQCLSLFDTLNKDPFTVINKLEQV